MAAKEKSQREKFIEKAKELGASESAEDFNRAFEKIVPPKNIKSVPPKSED